MTSPALVHVLKLDAFRQRYARWLPALDADTRRLGKTLQRVGLRRVLVVSRCLRHDQSTQWWYEQARLSGLAAAGIEVTFVTDGLFVDDLERLLARGPEPRLVCGEDARPPPGPFDAVVALPPSDVATSAALELRVPLVACVTKKLESGNRQLTVSPPRKTVLWHGFAGSRAFEGNVKKELFGKTTRRWRLRAAPFPMHRYYAPRSDTRPSRRVLLFGTQDRDLHMAMATLRAAGESRIAVLGAPRHREDVSSLATRHGIAVDWWANLSHGEMIELVASCAIVSKPVLTESHYSLVLPITRGRPGLGSRADSAASFHEPGRFGVQLLDKGDVDSWARAIAALNEHDAWTRACDDAAARAVTHHDAERFFASAMVGTFGGATGLFEAG